MPRGTDDRDQGLTEADRRAIADIRRELDDEFGPIGETEPPPTEPAPASGTTLPARDVMTRPRRQERRRRQGSFSAFVVGALVGGLAGGVAGGATAYLALRMGERPGIGWAGDAGAPTDSPAAAAVERVEAPARALEEALGEWLDATRRGDIERQMRFYPARVPVYYTWRDVPRAAVREEKIKVFGGATTLEIATDTPTVTIAADGRSAVTRFRKRFVIEGPVIRRRGEVVQDLRWSRTADGWRIVAERDAEVLAP